MERETLELILIGTGGLGFLAFVIKLYLHYLYIQDCRHPLERNGLLQHSTTSSSEEALTRLAIILPFIIRNMQAEKRQPSLQKSASWIWALSIIFVVCFTLMVILSNYLY